MIDAERETILGAVIRGIGGDEVVHSILDVIYVDARYTTL